MIAFQNPQISVFLALSRWVAAALVVLFHIHLMILAPAAAGEPAYAYAVYVLSSFGTDAVMVFFVLSGFLVGGASLAKSRSGSFDFLDYAAHRSARIYIVLIPALLLTVVADRFGIWETADSPYYVWIFGLHHGTSLPILLGNLAMLAEIRVPDFGSNAPIWSLANEAWYYVLFALGLYAFLSKDWRQRAFVGVLTAFVVVVVGKSVLLLGLAWAAGVVVWAKADVLKRWAPPVSIGFGVFAASLAASFRIRGHDGMAAYYGADAAVAAGFIVLLLSVIRSDTLRIPFPRFHARMADFSYSLYLTHFPIVLLLVAVLQPRLGLPFKGQVTGAALLVFLICTVGSYAVALGSYALFERRTPALRQTLYRLGAAAFRRPGALASQTRPDAGAP